MKKVMVEIDMGKIYIEMLKEVEHLTLILYIEESKIN